MATARDVKCKIRRQKSGTQIDFQLEKNFQQQIAMMWELKENNTASKNNVNWGMRAVCCMEYLSTPIPQRHSSAPGAVGMPSIEGLQGTAFSYLSVL